MEKKKAYLYSRVSKASQAEEGHGIERQIEKALEFLKDKPEYELDDSNVITDLGVSAYSGDNIKNKAGLGAFFEALRRGYIKRGSLLIIEAPDRLTRLGIRKGQRLFDELAEYGIDVALVRFNLIIKHDDENDFQGSLILSVGLYLGHLESQQKSERIRSTMQKRRDEMREGKIKSNRDSQSPRWVTENPSKDGFIVNPLGKAIKEMFALRLQGLGANKITQRLKQEGYKDEEGKEIPRHTVNHYLRSRQVLGEYQPYTRLENDKNKRKVEGEPIKDFYPRLVSDEDFYEVQRLLNEHGVTGEYYHNYLRNIVRCPVCSSMTQLKMTRDNKSGKQYFYLHCSDKIKKLSKEGCKWKGVSFTKIEKFILPILRELDFLKLSKVTGKQSVSSEHKRLSERLSEIENAILTNTNTLHLLDGAARDAVKQVIRSYEEEAQKIREELYSSHTVTDNELQETTEEFQEVDLETVEGRKRFNKILSRFVDYIECHEKSWDISFNGLDLCFGFEYSTDEIMKERMSYLYGFRRDLEKGNTKPIENLMSPED